MFLLRNYPIRIIRGLVQRGDPQAIPNVFEIKPALVAGSNILPFIVLLQSQRSQHRRTHLDANKFQVVRVDVGNPVQSSQNIANSQQKQPNSFKRNPQHLGDRAQWGEWVISENISNIPIRLVSRGDWSD
jgi:hypothetical protein